MITTCKDCEAGKYSSEASINRQQCSDCTVGTFSNIGATICMLCPAGKFAEPLSFYLPCPDSSCSPLPYGSSGCTACSACRDPLAIALNPCLAGSSSDTTTGCICPDGYFVRNAIDPYNISCVACKACSGSAFAVLLNSCEIGSTVDTTTGCRCSEGFNTSVASDPYNVTCIPLLNQRPSQPSETGAPGTAAPGSITIVNNYIR